jgi:hypothetical protein
VAVAIIPSAPGLPAVTNAGVAAGSRSVDEPPGPETTARAGASSSRLTITPSACRFPSACRLQRGWIDKGTEQGRIASGRKADYQKNSEKYTLSY